MPRSPVARLLLYPYPLRVDFRQRPADQKGKYAPALVVARADDPHVEPAIPRDGAHDGMAAAAVAPRDDDAADGGEW